MANREISSYHDIDNMSEGITMPDQKSHQAMKLGMKREEVAKLRNMWTVATNDDINDDHDNI